MQTKTDGTSLLKPLNDLPFYQPLTLNPSWEHQTEKPSEDQAWTSWEGQSWGVPLAARLGGSEDDGAGSALNPNLDRS